MFSIIVSLSTLSFKSNKEPCELFLFCFNSFASSIKSGIFSKIPFLGKPNLSNAPPWTKASTPRLLRDLDSILDKKSWILSNLDPSRSIIIFWAVISPTFLIADKPNKISPLFTEKSSRLKFISGVFTFTFISLASDKKIAVLSLSLFTAVKQAERYSAG